MAGKLTRDAQIMLELLGKETIKKMKYTNPDDKMDCLQSGLLDMYSNWHNFNEEKGDNAFAYFTEIFKRGMSKGMNQLRKKKGEKCLAVKTASLTKYIYIYTHMYIYIHTYVHICEHY